MLRQPAVAGRFYPSDPNELTAAVHDCVRVEREAPSGAHTLNRVKACLVPHAGYVYSGHVAGAVLSRILLPRRILILGVRHYPRGQQVAINSAGAWRTPLGDAPIDRTLAEALRAACPLIREDPVAHSSEHSLEVQLPFLQILAPGFAFVPLALGTVRFEDLVSVGEAIGGVLASAKEETLLLTTSDLNHYEDDATTREKDAKAVERLKALDAPGLHDTCRNEKISMCGLGPAVAMLVALRALGAKQTEVIRYATSADVSGDTSAVVGYVGMTFN